ncbi:hypothetical protein FSP39_003456 [Pinctada imbricata]|uniref:Bardet-Biedl syndrome 1 n=1 Tax=Pinctada imbricata TaxID=66713 RepID=A0AA89BSC9_PINIB|nr:hypothetical protein FSP39_003456 [Pinctada imbricata]
MIVFSWYRGSNEKWLDAYKDPVASLYTLTQCITLSDVQADGDWKLIIADLGTGTFDMKLKVYKGTNLMSENTIIDLPTGVETFYMDTHEPRTPAIAVASGPYIYVYKNLRPYFKFTLPTLEVNPVEADLWNQVKEEKINIFVLREMLEGMRAEGTVLTVRSLRFLQLQDITDCEAFANLYRFTPLRRQTVITSLATLKKSHADEDAISCLVLGTESKSVYVLDPEAFTVLTTMELPSVPVFLSVTGLFDVEYRIVVACRNGCIYTLKRGTTVTTKNCIELNSQPVGLQRINKTIYVGTMDEALHCYTSKGKKLWTVKLPASMTTMEIIDYKPKGFKAVIVALSNCNVHIYKEKYLVNIIKTDDVVTGLKFGRFGREDGTLIMTLRAMHRTFQRDLYLLRLNTAREYVKSLENRMNPISSDPQEPLKLNATVQGIGPMFKLTVNLQNTSLSNPSTNLLITFQYDDKLYAFKNSFIEVPMLVPGLNYAFETYVECQSDKGISDNVKVYILRQGKSIPIITGIISMPCTDVEPIANVKKKNQDDF